MVTGGVKDTPEPEGAAVATAQPRHSSSHCCNTAADADAAVHVRVAGRFMACRRKVQRVWVSRVLCVRSARARVCVQDQ